VFPGAAEGEFTLNGGAALHFRRGDRLVVAAYRQEESFSGAIWVIVDRSDNSSRKRSGIKQTPKRS
jgi:aspartate 1-decarboxylase